MNNEANVNEQEQATVENEQDLQQENAAPEAGANASDDHVEGAAEAEAAGNPELESLRAEAAEHQQRLLRVQADYDNFRRRTQKEKEELAKYASSKLISELLPVFDNFERALAAGVSEQNDPSSFVKGVEMIFRQFEGVLKAEGLTIMETVGQPFNPEYHQAIMTVEVDEYEEGIVVEELQKGYMLKDKVLRPAMVKVSG
ncbi:molecular chaperone GrpE [Paenibacillus yonginensis]|uniref:Protein GrpE n=1 Tax=Paenibacillus yonginensis TaxID=1462996 RepID=A0A1B1N703_9BACL|nr:nucleotide exchange factor GrpE [Paenibacillus yonginensis]ANS77208.1 molecular chaperone GrpE [Paenibacillus yonginensis]